MGDEVNQAVMLATMDGKLDRIGDKLDQLGKDSTDHEGRIRVLESKHYVTPAAMWLGIGAVAAVVGAAAPFLAQLYGG